MFIGEIRQFCKLEDNGQSLMQAVMTQMNLSTLAYHRIPWTDRPAQAETGAHNCRFGGSEDIQSAHLAEALRYRPKIMIG
jgi:predicted ATPase with chaperone activity